MRVRRSLHGGGGDRFPPVRAVDAQRADAAAGGHGGEAVNATIIHGVTTNRVIVHRDVKPAKAREPKRYRKDRSTRGKPYKLVCICLPVEDLRAIDAHCDAVKVARSELLRAAALERIGKKRSRR